MVNDPHWVELAWKFPFSTCKYRVLTVCERNRLKRATLVPLAMHTVEYSFFLLVKWFVVLFRKENKMLTYDQNSLRTVFSSTVSRSLWFVVNERHRYLRHCRRTSLPITWNVCVCLNPKCRESWQHKNSIKSTYNKWKQCNRLMRSWMINTSK